jgi:hypothetical protein
MDDEQVRETLVRESDDALLRMEAQKDDYTETALRIAREILTERGYTPEKTEGERARVAFVDRHSRGKLTELWSLAADYDRGKLSEIQEAGAREVLVDAEVYPARFTKEARWTSLRLV